MQCSNVAHEPVAEAYRLRWLQVCVPRHDDVYVTLCHVTAHLQADGVVATVYSGFTHTECELLAYISYCIQAYACLLSSEHLPCSVAHVDVTLTTIICVKTSAVTTVHCSVLKHPTTIATVFLIHCS